MIKYGAYSLVILAIVGGSYYEGYAGQHDKLVTFKAQVEQQAKDQEAIVKSKEAEYERNLKNAEQNSSYAAQSISDYYLQHPSIRLLHDNTCTVSKANDSPKGSNDTSTSGYISAYAPELTEQLASQLDQLQKLLIANGVTVQ